MSNYKTGKAINLNIKDLEDISSDLRCDVFKMIHIAKSGHPGG